MSSDSDEDIVPALYEFIKLCENDENRSRKYWVHPYRRIREQEDTIINKIAELRSYPDKFQNFTQLKIETFDYLLQLIGAKIEKQNTNYRRSLKPEERLIITLRYLATGESFRSLSYFFRCGASTIANIVPETCEAIWETLSPIYLPKPDAEKWCSIANDFEKIWNFPNCVGAIDGKHIRMQRPPGAASEFFNYKKFHSIHLLGVCDAHGKFIYVHVGDYGRNCDSSVFKNSSFGKGLINNEMNLPEKRQLFAGCKDYFPYVFVADEAYPLQINMMRPFSRKNLTKETKIYNYRLARARRIIECAFGILTKKFRRFESTIILSPDKLKPVVLAACALHNMIRERENLVNDIFDEHNSLMRTNSEKNEHQQTARPTTAARVVRNKFVEYFSSEHGSVPWQDKYVN